jgi:hypothetical protein
MKCSLKIPLSLSPIARACLQRIAERGHGGLVSIGGAIGLSYYFEYRTTADVDAWWEEEAGKAQRDQLLKAIEEVLAEYGNVRRRSWGDVTSVELLQKGAVVFSFQVARRSVRLQATEAAPWPEGLRVDSFEDLAAAKMEALVARGAPRDFRDIYTLCREGITNPEELWALWARRRTAAREDTDDFQAALAVRTHLERIERTRPLARIAKAAEREAASELRAWFKESFLHGLV